MSDIQLTVSLSPHIKTVRSTSQIMWFVVLALLPALVLSVFVFGPTSLVVCAVAVFTAVLSEYLAEYLIKKPKTILTPKKSTISDGSAALTGLLLAFNLPASIPLWQVVIGAFFAIIVAKVVFGGLGQNVFNPALAGRAFMMASFPTTMTVFPKPFGWLTDGVSAATALGSAKEGAMRGFTLDALREQGLLAPHFDLFFGLTGGSLGEVSALAILIGGIFLILIKIVSWETPTFYLLGLAACTGIAWLIDPNKYLDPLYHVISGGAMLAGFFMLSDMVTSPMTKMGRLVYSLLTGILTAIIRLFGSYPEGASYAILIMNSLVPVFDQAFPPKKFGTQTQKIGGKV